MYFLRICAGVAVAAPVAAAATETPEGELKDGEAAMEETCGFHGGNFVSNFALD